MWSFLFNIFAYDLAWASGTPSGVSTVASDRASGPGLSSENEPEGSSEDNIAIASWLSEMEKELDTQDVDIPSLALKLRAACDRPTPRPFELHIKYRETDSTKIVRFTIENGEYKCKEVKFSASNAVIEPIELHHLQKDHINLVTVASQVIFYGPVLWIQ